MAQENAQAQVQPTQSALPRHVAIIMDGNGRWANKKNLPRYMGHREGVKAVRRIVTACQNRGIEALTLFAFSSENWRRPKTEVGLLMDLFVHTLKKEVDRLDKNGVRMRFIGNRSAFDVKLRSLMDAAEAAIVDHVLAERPEGPVIAGIGVGMYPDYGPAQRMYVRRGYVPDGHGLAYDGRILPPMETTVNDDSLNLHFTRTLVSPR
jgi:hypothetical protein